MAFVLLLTAQLLVVADASVINVALPSIASALGFDRGGLQWVVTAYVLTYGGFLLLGGRLGDLLGSRRVLIVGLVIFGAAALAGGLAPSGPVLIAARAVQGFGAALITPTTLSLINTTHAAGTARNKALGWWGSINAAGFAVGVLLGGVLVEFLSWRAVLLINIPIAAPMAAAAWQLLPAVSTPRTARRPDVAGAVTITAAAALLIYAVTQAPERGWANPITVALLVAAAVSMAVFLLAETRSPAPLVPLSIFRGRKLRAANSVIFLFGLTSGAGVFLMLSLYMQQVLGYNALITGLAFLPLGALVLVIAPLTGRLMSRFRLRTTLLVGLVLVTSGLGYFTMLSRTGSYLTELLPGMALFGMGYGLVLVPTVTAATADLPATQQGLASGIVNTVANVAGAVGVAVYVTTAAVVASATGYSHAPAATGYAGAFFVGTAALALAIPLTAMTFPAHVLTAADTSSP